MRIVDRSIGRSVGGSVRFGYVYVNVRSACSRSHSGGPHSLQQLEQQGDGEGTGPLQVGVPHHRQDPGFSAHQPRTTVGPTGTGTGTGEEPAATHDGTRGVGRVGGGGAGVLAGHRHTDEARARPLHLDRIALYMPHL